MHAVFGGSAVIVQKLLSLDTVFNAANRLGRTAMMIAVETGHAANLALLLENGADVDAKNRVGETALMRAVHDGRIAIVKQLLATGADKNTADMSRRTLLMVALENGHAEMLRLLLQSGVDVDAKNRVGETALMLAAKENKLDFLHLLLQHGAEVNACGSQARNATVTAIETENMPVLELLMAYGGEPTGMKNTPSPLVFDMQQHGFLLSPDVVADAVMLERRYGEPYPWLLQIHPNVAVPAYLARAGVLIRLCSPIMLLLNEQLSDSGPLWPALAGTGSALSTAQKTSSIAGLLVGLGVWVQSWSPGWNPYQGTGLSAHAEANMAALLKFQVSKLVALGEQREMTLAASLETLLPQCIQFTQVRNGGLVVDKTKLMAYLTEQLGLYGLLADQVAGAWITAVNQQQAAILSSSLLLPGFDEQASEGEAGQALLAAFGSALKQIDVVAAGSLLRTSTLQGQQAGLYADLMFRQLHMLMQYADQAIATSSSTN